MEPIDPNYFKQKADELGLNRAEILITIQAGLDKLYPGRCRAVSLNRGVLKIVTQSASVAGELRLRQTLIIGFAPEIERLQIVIG